MSLACVAVSGSHIVMGNCDMNVTFLHDCVMFSWRLFFSCG